MRKGPGCAYGKCKIDIHINNFTMIINIFHTKNPNCLTANALMVSNGNDIFLDSENSLVICFASVTTKSLISHSWTSTKHDTLRELSSCSSSKISSSWIGCSDVNTTLISYKIQIVNKCRLLHGIFHIIPFISPTSWYQPKGWYMNEGW